MGANAQTTVPTFTAGQVLTAAQMNDSARTGVPVFADSSARDAAFGGTGEKTLAEGQLCYLEDTNEVQFYDGSSWTKLGGAMTKVEAFTTSGTFTPPTGVTYAIAHIRGGGGGTGTVGSTGGAGGTSSVAFASGTISATGGNLANNANAWNYQISAVAGVANSGQGASRSAQSDPGPAGTGQRVVGSDGAYIVAAAAVTPGTGITITVGAGGTAGSGGAAGGSGYVWIEYQE
jgi:hypothetical protein